MKILQKIEKRKEIWFLTFISFLFFLFRLPSLIEPHWYGDEGVYQLIGMALNSGRMLYSQIWDNKPPLLYLIYALVNADQFLVRLLSLIVGVGSIIPFYYLSQKLFKSSKISIFTTSLYVLLFATPILEGNIANAENFMLLPIITAGFLVYKSSKRSYLTLFLAGISLGTAFLLKIVAVFDFAAFLIFLIFIQLPEKLTLHKHQQLFKKILKQVGVYALGFLIPVTLTTFYFFVQGALIDFIQAAFFGNISYVGYKNKLIITQGFLFIKLLVLFTSLGLVFWKRKIIPEPFIFILPWFFFSIFNAFFSGREWTHYLLVLLPSAVLLIGSLFYPSSKKFKIIILGLLLILICSVNIFFKITIRTIGKTLQYYQNFTLFITNNKSAKEYQEYFDRRVTRDYEVARFIAANTDPDDTVFVWGNNPQIYVLSNTLPPGKYTVEYHMKATKNSISETAADIRRADPKYIVILSENANFPFSIGKYINRFNFEGADIYERIF